MSASVDLYCEALALCVSDRLEPSAVSALHETFWQAGNRIPALLSWAQSYRVVLTCPVCGGSGYVTTLLDINSIVSIPTDTPCPTCQILTVKIDNETKEVLP